MEPGSLDFSVIVRHEGVWLDVELLMWWLSCSTCRAQPAVLG